MIQPQLKVGHIPEPISLPFEGFDFVVGSLHHSTGNRVLEIAEKAGFVSGQGFGDPGKWFDPGLHGILDPDIKEGFPTLPILTIPEESQLLLHGMGDEKGLVGSQQGIQSGLPIGLKRFVVFQEQEPIALESLLPEFIQFPLLASADLINGSVHEG